MKRRLISSALTVLLIFLVMFGFNVSTVSANQSVPTDSWEAFAADSFGGGTGTESDPYQLESEEQLAYLAKSVNSGNRYSGTFFRLENDIDLSAHRWIPIGYWKATDDNNNVIDRAFAGSFNGNHKRIRGMIVDERTDKGAAGLFGAYFGRETKTPYIKNLIIENAMIYSSENEFGVTYAGILAGHIMVNSGQTFAVSDVFVTGTINNEATNGDYFIGGMVGDATRASFKNCGVKSIVINGGSNVGGFVGNSGTSSFDTCHATGSVTGGRNLGGFASYAAYDKSLFGNCYSDVDVTGNGRRLGGFIAFAASQNIEIENCISLGNVTSTLTGSDPKVGGFVGESSGKISNSYAEGVTTIADTTYKAGGFIGTDALGTTKNCMFDKTLNPTLEAIGIEDESNMNDIKAGTTFENKSAICINIVGFHACDESSWISDDTGHWHVCDYCGGKVKEADHIPGDWTIDQEATITHPGSQSSICTICGATLVEELPVLPHDHETGIVWCLDKTSHWHECKLCGKKLDSEAHTTGEWIIDRSATETTEGLKHKECKVCYGILESTSIPKLTHEHVEKLGWSFDVTNHWHECTTCNEKLDVARHTASDWIIDVVATNTTKGQKHKACTVCGTIVETKTYAFDEVYQCVDGAHRIWQETKDTSLNFRINGAFDKFVSVKVNGVILDESNYSKEAGSTIIKFNDTYLKTLRDGTHELTVVFTDGAAKTDFIIKTKTDIIKDTAQHPTKSGLQLVDVLGMLLIFGGVGITVLNKRRNTMK